MKPVKYMDLGEFRELGFLQEVNRRLLHPAGLALEMQFVGGEWRFGGVWDYRDDPEGITYSTPAGLDPAKVEAVDAELAKHLQTRIAMFGSMIQPLS